MKRLAAFTIAMVFSVAAMAISAPQEPIEVTNYGKKAAVTFDHAKHLAQGLDCMSCHHKADEGKFKCGECHLLDAQGSTPKIKEAMHGKAAGACYTCHLESGAEKKMKCSECHIK